MVEYSGMAFALFFLGEYANMILLSCMASIMFLGGWASPIDIAPLTWIPGWIWLDHAFGLENLHPADRRLAGRGGDLDADALEHLALSRQAEAGYGSDQRFLRQSDADRVAQGHAPDGQVLFQAQGHLALSAGKDAYVGAFPRPARIAPLPQRGGALHRVQAVRSRVPGLGDHH
ncbi:hypothetical protein G6F65_019841 [Rhizopus arrhizus]|nr:hypothetical protein G6F65_019841 [Rhizopus arrhizus]